MNKAAINRIKIVLAENSKTNKWLAGKLDRTEATVSRWCTNDTQPPIETMLEIAKHLKVDIKDLFNSTKK